MSMRKTIYADTLPEVSREAMKFIDRESAAGRGAFRATIKRDGGRYAAVIETDRDEGVVDDDDDGARLGGFPHIRAPRRARF